MVHANAMSCLNHFGPEADQIYQSESNLIGRVGMKLKLWVVHSREHIMMTYGAIHVHSVVRCTEFATPGALEVLKPFVSACSATASGALRQAETVPTNTDITDALNALRTLR